MLELYTVNKKENPVWKEKQQSKGRSLEGPFLASVPSLSAGVLAFSEAACGEKDFAWHLFHFFAFTSQNEQRD